MKHIRKQLEDLLHKMQSHNTPDHNLNEYCNHLKKILADDWSSDPDNDSDDDSGTNQGFGDSDGDSSNPGGPPPPPPGGGGH